MNSQRTFNQGNAMWRRISSIQYPASGLRAFSLIELVLVLAIVLVLGAVAAPRYAGANARYRADFAAQRIAADLRLSQTTARTSGTTTKLAFSVDQDFYQLAGVAALDGSGTYTVNLGESPYLATLTTADFGGDAILNFNGWGQPDSSGSVTLTVGTEQRTITLSSPSGEVKIL